MAKARSKTEVKPTTSAGAAAAPGTKTAKPRGTTSRTRQSARQVIRCYLCGHRHEVSTKTMSTTCPACHKAIKVEDVQVKSYLPVNDLQTCGQIKITRRGRVAARNVQSGKGVVCEGTMEGNVETEGPVALGPKSSWRGALLQSKSLAVSDGATLDGHVRVPWIREADAEDTNG